MANDQQRPIIVRRKKKGGEAHHGGAWKIAYADFVTAMMAFFLLMWLLGSTSKGDLQGIAEYFQNPLKVSLSGGSGAGDAMSIINKGGKDLTRETGQTKGGPTKEQKMGMDVEAAKRELLRAEAAKLAELKDRINTLIETTPSLKSYQRQLLLDITNEGLRIQIVDEQNRPMFASGKAELQPYTREILREIAKVLNEVDNRIALSGHTDAKPYAGGEKGYGNWELSADRANASRRELVKSGLADGKVLRVVGLASSVLFDKDDASNPTNRRISIVVLNRKAEEAITTDGKISEAVKEEGQGEAPPAAPDAAAPGAASPPAPADASPAKP